MNPTMEPDVKTAFYREWEPLLGALSPIEYLGKGVFACEHQNAGTGEGPVVLWDAAADLAEQAFIQVAENADQYFTLRKNGKILLEDVSFDIRRQKRKAEIQLARDIDAFNRFADWFHKEYQNQQAGTATEDPDDLMASAFEHDQKNRALRYDEWKPQRFCVHDHLMGVMGYRFNRMPGRMEVAEFATRDHNNYARGSATRALLLCLLCEWAKQSSLQGIVFVEDWRNPQPDSIPVPYEVTVYGQVLGVDIKPGARELSWSVCQDLFLKLTPFSCGTRAILEREGFSAKACLVAHKGIWTISQIEDLVTYCPLALDIFEGGILPEEQLKMSAVMEHAKPAVMAGIAEQMVRVQAEENQAGITFNDQNFQWAYARFFTCGCDIFITCLEGDRLIEQQIPANQRFALIPWPANARTFNREVGTVMRKLQFEGLQADSVYLLTPEQAVMNMPPGSLFSSGIHLALMHETLESIRQAAWRNIQQAGRLRK